MNSNKTPPTAGRPSSALLGQYNPSHHSHGGTRFRVDIVVGEWWAEYATAPHETFAKEIARSLLKEGKKVRLSKLHDCIQLGTPIEP